MSKMVSAHLFSLDIGIDVLGPRQDNSNVIPFLIEMIANLTGALVATERTGFRNLRGRVILDNWFPSESN